MPLLAGVIAATAAPLAAQPGPKPSIALASTVLVERIVRDANGATHTEQAPADRVTPGDRLVFRTSFRNDAGKDVRDFVITNPVHPAVQLAPDGVAGLTVSVDKGRTWGALGALQVVAPDGTKRAAALEDITHVRWTLGVITPGETGERAFAAVVK